MSVLELAGVAFFAWIAIAILTFFYMRVSNGPLPKDMGSRLMVIGLCAFWPAAWYYQSFGD